MLSWIINSFYFEYRSPIRSEMNIFVPKFKSELDLHTPNRPNYSNINIEKDI
jgi:hypothetical protein